MAFLENLGQIRSSLFLRFLKKGDFQEYDFTNVFYAIRNSTDFKEFVDLFYEFGCFEQNESFVRDLLNRCSLEKSSVIQYEFFIRFPQYLFLDPFYRIPQYYYDSLDIVNLSDFKKSLHSILHHPAFEYIIYNSLIRYWKGKEEAFVSDEFFSFLKFLCIESSIFPHTQEIKKILRFLMYSSRPGFQEGIEMMTSYLIQLRDQQKSNLEFRQSILMNYFFEILHDDRYFQDESFCVFIRNSFSFPKNVPVLESLKGLFDQYKQNDRLRPFFHTLALSLLSEDPRKGLQISIKNIVQSLKDDKTDIRNFIQSIQTMIEKSEHQQADGLLENF